MGITDGLSRRGTYGLNQLPLDSSIVLGSQQAGCCSCYNLKSCWATRSSVQVLPLSLKDHLSFHSSHDESTSNQLVSSNP